VADTYRLILHYYQGDFERGLEAGARGRAILTRCGDRTELSFAYVLSVLCHLQRGSLTEAMQLSEEGIEVMLRTDSRAPSRGVLAVGGRVAAQLGRHEQAQSLLDESLELCGQAHDLLFETWTRVMVCDARLAAGDVAGALEHLEEARRMREANGLLPEFLVETYPLLAVAYAERAWSEVGAGRLGNATRQRLEAAVHRALKLTRRRRHYRSPALRAAAVLAWLGGRQGQAERLFERASRLAEALGARLQLAEVRLARGRCLLLDGRADAGRSPLDAALSLFEACGAAPAAQRARAALRGCL
jgi:tetratricopeptide (TPR) repeat protein